MAGRFFFSTLTHSTTAAPELSMQLSIVCEIIVRREHSEFPFGKDLTFSWIIVCAWRSLFFNKPESVMACCRASFWLPADNRFCRSPR